MIYPGRCAGQTVGRVWLPCHAQRARLPRTPVALACLPCPASCVQLSQYNYILVVGEEERVAGTVNVRTRDNQVHGMHSLAGVIDVMSRERSSRSQVGLFGEDKAAAAEPAADGAEQ